jgi:hypothetical protein
MTHPFPGEEGTDSARMAMELKQLRYSNEKVKVLESGLVLWDGKGYPMVKQKTPGDNMPDWRGAGPLQYAVIAMTGLGHLL